MDGDIRLLAITQNMTLQKILHFNSTKLTMENTNNKKIIIGIVAAVIIAGVGYWLYSKQPSKPTSPVLARVGSLSVTEKDVAYRFGVERAYGDTSATGQDILQALVKDATEQEVAKAFGVFPMAIDIENFKKNADKTSKAPELLAAIKSVFGLSVDSYDRIYILPKIVNPSLHTFFSNNKEMNKVASALIEKALAEVLAGGTFSDVAKNNGLLYATSTQSSVAPAVPLAMQKYVSNNEIPKSAILTLAESLKPGEMNKTVIEDNYSYSIVRLISAEKGVYKIESITSVKRDYDTWYKEEAKKIPVVILK